MVILEGGNMGDKTMKHLKGAFQGALGVLALAAVAVPSEARITLDALGGEVMIEGYLKSEVRSRMGAGPSYMGQWINRLQVEAALEYDNVGIFDELSFFAIIRPEYDVIQDTGNFSNRRIGQGSSRPSLQGRSDFNFANDGLGWGGFDFALGDGFTSTGGIGKLVTQGMMIRPNSTMIEVDFRYGRNGQIARQTGAGFLTTGTLATTTTSAFPLVVQRASNLNLRCAQCVDLNVDNLDVAMANTDSNGRLYPFRELYADGVAGDWWIRVGKQQIVWGKTDFFRLQDVINPVDFGQHFFFDSFEDIRIPQWMASIQYKAGSIGPLTDNAVQVVWNFDQFQRVGLGNPSHFWAHPFSKDISTFALFNHYFSTEPCFGPASRQVQNGTALPSDICGALGPRDQRLPSGFGTPQGLNAENRPNWDIDNTEAGWRWEFRLSDFRFAVSHWYGWNDTPAFKFHTVNLATGLIGHNVTAADAAKGDMHR